MESSKDKKDHQFVEIDMGNILSYFLEVLRKEKLVQSLPSNLEEDSFFKISKLVKVHICML